MKLFAIFLSLALAAPMLRPTSPPNPDHYDDCAAYALKKKLPLVVFFHKTTLIRGPWVSTKFSGPWHIDPTNVPSIVVFPFKDGEFDVPVIATDETSILSAIDPR